MKRNDGLCGWLYVFISYLCAFIVGTDGVIRAKPFLEGFKERHSVAALVEALKNAQ